MKDGVYRRIDHPEYVLICKGNQYRYLKHKEPRKLKLDNWFSIQILSGNLVKIGTKYYFDLITKDSI